MANKLKGRPSDEDSPKLRQELWELFNQGYSVLGASNESKHNYKTVAKYWKEFSNKINEDIDIDFIIRQKVSKEICLAGLDRDIKRIEEELDQMQEKETEEPENSDWNRLRQGLLLGLANLRQQKADIEMSPTVGESLETLATKYIEEQNNEKESTESKVNKTKK